MRLNVASFPVSAESCDMLEYDTIRKLQGHISVNSSFKKILMNKQELMRLLANIYTALAVV